MFTDTDTHTPFPDPAGAHFLISDTYDRGGGHRVSLRSAWLSTRKKVPSQGKHGKGDVGLGGGGRGEEGPPSPLQALLALSTPTPSPPARERGSRSEGLSGTRPEAAYPR